jgi:hypothetical protein
VRQADPREKGDERQEGRKERVLVARPGKQTAGEHKDDEEAHEENLPRRVEGAESVKTEQCQYPGGAGEVQGEQLAEIDHTEEDALTFSRTDLRSTPATPDEKLLNPHRELLVLGHREKGRRRIGKAEKKPRQGT